MANDAPLAFFSYSRQDTEFVLKLAKDLRAGGAAVWLDQLDISPGQRWDSAVEQALANCPKMLLVLSPASVDSTNVMDEVSFALEEHKLVIPVLYRDCKIPFRLRRVQYIDVRTDYDRGLHELLRMLGVESAPGAERTMAAAARSGAVNVAAGASVEEVQAETARIAKEREEAEAAKARREQEERERAAREQGAARIAKEREEAGAAKARREQADRERSAQDQAASAPREHSAAETVQYKPAIERPPQGSSRKLVIGGIAAAVLLGAGIGIWQMTSTPDSRPGSSAPSQRLPSPEPSAVSESYGRPTGKKKAEPETRVSTEWIRNFVEAGQGPSTKGLRPYFADVVAPYYSLPSANWAAIEKDKSYYFSRFPTIRYTLADEPQRTSVSGGEVLDFNIRYENVRKDGQVAKGISHLKMTVQFIGDAPKIVGIEERSIRE